MLIMDKSEWAEKIKDACKQAGTYEPFFDIVIDELAGIMQTKSDAEEMYKKSGGSPVIKYTNKGGFTNLRKNPALVVIQECNQQALAYWRELGLTSKAYKSIEGAFKKREETDAFSELLGDIL